MSEISDAKAMHLIKVMDMNNLTTHERERVLLFVLGALLRATEMKYDVDESMWLNLVSEAIAKARSDNG